MLPLAPLPPGVCTRLVVTAVAEHAEQEPDERAGDAEPAAVTARGGLLPAAEQGPAAARGRRLEREVSARHTPRGTKYLALCQLQVNHGLCLC